MTKGDDMKIFLDSSSSFLTNNHAKTRGTFSIELIDTTIQKFNSSNKITQNMGQYQCLINRSHKKFQLLNFQLT